MLIHIHNNPLELGLAAGKQAEKWIKSCIKERGEANIILATGTSQFETLAYLVNVNTISWDLVTMFHLDEYVGIGEDHPASFRKYLKERFIERIPSLKNYYLIDGDLKDPQSECTRLGEIIQQAPIDVALIGIGENGHLAFNDPPADFDTHEPYLVVELDEACRKQQVGEGWFANLNKVPSQAISMSIQQILKSEHLVVSVPDARKSFAVRRAVEGPITPQCPASILQQHPSCDLFLDVDSAARLS